jgi:hypothetical protein
MVIKKSFNAGAVSESDVIVDWLYTSKTQGRPPLANLPPAVLLMLYCRQSVQGTIRASAEVTPSHTIPHHLHFAALPAFFYHDTPFGARATDHHTP